MKYNTFGLGHPIGFKEFQKVDYWANTICVHKAKIITILTFVILSLFRFFNLFKGLLFRKILKINNCEINFYHIQFIKCYHLFLCAD